MAARPSSYKSYLQLESTAEVPRCTWWRKAPKLSTVSPATVADPPTDCYAHDIEVVYQPTSIGSPPNGHGLEALRDADNCLPANDCGMDSSTDLAGEEPILPASEDPFLDDPFDINSNGLITDVPEPPLVQFTSEELMDSHSDPSPDDHSVDCNSGDDVVATQEETMEKESSHRTSPPIYANAPVTVAVSCLLILTYAMRYSLTGEAIGDLLQLVRAHCPSPNQVCSSLYHFRRYFKGMKLPVKFHHFCTACNSLLRGLGGSRYVCPNTACKQETTVGRVPQNFFLEMDLKQQLQQILGRPEVCQEVFTHRFNRNKKNAANVEDIYDGSLYRECCEHGGILSDKRNLSLTINTDGVQVFKSPPSSMWPIYFCINELPLKMRMKKENLILAGLWFGRSKPEMSTFLEPFVKKLKELESGITIVNSKFGTFVSKAILLLATYDKPAKSAVQNFTQYNGRYGCGRCQQPGRTFYTSQNGHVHVFPYQPTDPAGPPRTAALVSRHSHEAVACGTSVKGVKGPSWLSTLTYFDIVRGSLIDYMHTVLLGVCRGLLCLWFDSSHHSEPWYIGTKRKEVDDRLTSVTPPSCISRAPRSVVERKNWKAHEFRAWLLHYSLPVLSGLLPDVYFQHYLLLVHAVYLLLQSSISPNDIKSADAVLNHFVFLMPVLYSERYMSANIHDLLHLAQCVSDAGPLYVFSCFAFESTNHTLVRMIHGTQAVPQQVAQGMSNLQCIPVLAKELFRGGGISVQAAELLEKLTETIFSANEIEAPLCLGKGQPFHMGEEHVMMLTAALNTHRAGTVQLYQRIKLRNFVLDSLEYTRSEKRTNSCIAYKDSIRGVSFGTIKYFLCVEDEVSCRVLAVINALLPTASTFSTDILTHATAEHIKLVEAQSADCCIPVEQILMKSVMMHIGTACYVSQFPNLIESD